MLRMDGGWSSLKAMSMNRTLICGAQRLHIVPLEDWERAFIWKRVKDKKN